MKNMTRMRKKLKDIHLQITKIEDKIKNKDFNCKIVGGEINTELEMKNYLKFQILRYYSLKKAIDMKEENIIKVLNRMKKSMCRDCKGDINKGKEGIPCAKDFKAYSIYYTVRYGFR